jgi:CheY-like chemotaxis protein
MRSDALRQRVLVVDNERIIADTLVLILSLEGFEAIAAYNGEDAVEAAIAFRPDVLITDVFMERMNGIEASLQISAILPLCRVILFSGNTETANLLQEAEAHGYRFEIVAKPVHPSDFFDRLSTTPSSASARLQQLH